MNFGVQMMCKGKYASLMCVILLLSFKYFYCVYDALFAKKLSKSITGHMMHLD